MTQLFYWMLCLTLLLGCSKDKSIDNPDEPETPKEITLDLSDGDLVFESAGGEKMFTITSNAEWTITNESDWCTTDVSSGTGNRTVTVTTQTYENALGDRNMNLTVKSGDKTAVLTVTQKHGNAIVPDKAKFEVPQSGGDLAIKVRSNVTYEVTIPETCSSWIQPAPETRSEVSDTTYRFVISENETDDSRTGYIIFSAASLNDTVRIFQSQQDRLVLTQREYKLSAKDTTLTVELKTNVDYEVSILGDASSWVSRMETRACRVDRLQFHIEENNSGVSRTARIAVRDKNGELSDTLIVWQFDVENLDELDITDDFDPEFVKVLEERGYIPDATHITLADVKDIDSLEVHGTYEDWKAGKGLTSLAGIEHFESLTKLYCFYNQLTSLDVSKNTALTYLDCSSNQLTSLDLSKNIALTKLVCTFTQLTSLDVSECSALTYLECPWNHSLTFLDVSGCTALTYLNCHDGQLTSLDVSQNIALTTLYCSYNQLTFLDLTKNIALTTLGCGNNQFMSLNVSGCTALTWLSCSFNNLTSLNVNGCTALTSLDCYNNQLTALDVSGCTALTSLDCYNNQLTALDVSGCTALTVLYCDFNNLTSLNVNGCTALTSLDCYNNQLTALDVSGCTALTVLYCDFNNLTSLNVNGCTALTRLKCYKNQLTALDVSGCTALTDLWCRDNQLTSLDLSKNIALTSLGCYNNQLTSLDVSECIALTSLDCYNNQLTSLDLSKNIALTTLVCYKNPGDKESLFPVAAWFDNDNIPENMKFYYNDTQDGKSWTYDGKTIRIDFRKAE